MSKTRAESDTARAHATTTALRIAVGRLNRRLREESQSGLTASQRSVLSLLEREGPATVTTLARREGVRPQSMGATVSALEAEGFVVGAPDPADGRQTILSLTTMSREWLKARRAEREDWLFRAIRTKLDAHEQRTLAAAIELLDRLAEQ